MTTIQVLRSDLAEAERENEALKKKLAFWRNQATNLNDEWKRAHVPGWAENEVKILLAGNGRLKDLVGDLYAALSERDWEDTLDELGAPVLKRKYDPRTLRIRVEEELAK